MIVLQESVNFCHINVYLPKSGREKIILQYCGRIMATFQNSGREIVLAKSAFCQISILNFISVFQDSEKNSNEFVPLELKFNCLIISKLPISVVSRDIRSTIALLIE